MPPRIDGGPGLVLQPRHLAAAVLPHERADRMHHHRSGSASGHFEYARAAATDIRPASVVDVRVEHGVAGRGTDVDSTLRIGVQVIDARDATLLCRIEPEVDGPVGYVDGSSRTRGDNQAGSVRTG